MTNTNTAPAALTLTQAATAALLARGAGATIKVALPGGDTGHADCRDLWIGGTAQTIKVWKGGNFSYWFASQLTVVA